MYNAFGQNPLILRHLLQKILLGRYCWKQKITKLELSLTNKWSFREEKAALRDAPSWATLCDRQTTTELALSSLTVRDALPSTKCLWMHRFLHRCPSLFPRCWANQATSRFKKLIKVPYNYPQVVLFRSDFEYIHRLHSPENNALSNVQPQRETNQMSFSFFFCSAPKHWRKKAKEGSSTLNI